MQPLMYLCLLGTASIPAPTIHLITVSYFSEGPDVKERRDINLLLQSRLIWGEALGSPENPQKTCSWVIIPHSPRGMGHVSLLNNDSAWKIDGLQQLHFIAQHGKCTPFFSQAYSENIPTVDQLVWYALKEVVRSNKDMERLTNTSHVVFMLPKAMIIRNPVSLLGAALSARESMTNESDVVLLHFGAAKASASSEQSSASTVQDSTHGHFRGRIHDGPQDSSTIFNDTIPSFAPLPQPSPAQSAVSVRDCELTFVVLPTKFMLKYFGDEEDYRQTNDTTSCDEPAGTSSTAWAAPRYKGNLCEFIRLSARYEGIQVRDVPRQVRYTQQMDEESYTEEDMEDELVEEMEPQSQTQKHRTQLEDQHIPSDMVNALNMRDSANRNPAQSSLSTSRNQSAGSTAISSNYVMRRNLDKHFISVLLTADAAGLEFELYPSQLSAHPQHLYVLPKLQYPADPTNANITLTTEAARVVGLESQWDCQQRLKALWNKHPPHAWVPPPMNPSEDSVSNQDQAQTQDGGRGAVMKAGYGNTLMWRVAAYNDTRGDLCRMILGSADDWPSSAAGSCMREKIASAYWAPGTDIHCNRKYSDMLGACGVYGKNAHEIDASGRFWQAAVHWARGCSNSRPSLEEQQLDLQQNEIRKHGVAAIKAVPDWMLMAEDAAFYDSEYIWDGSVDQVSALRPLLSGYLVQPRRRQEEEIEGLRCKCHHHHWEGQSKSECDDDDDDDDDDIHSGAQSSRTADEETEHVRRRGVMIGDGPKPSHTIGDDPKQYQLQKEEEEQQQQLKQYSAAKSAYSIEDDRYQNQQQIDEKQYQEAAGSSGASSQSSNRLASNLYKTLLDISRPQLINITARCEAEKLRLVAAISTAAAEEANEVEAVVAVEAGDVPLSRENGYSFDSTRVEKISLRDLGEAGAAQKLQRWCIGLQSRLGAIFDSGNSNISNNSSNSSSCKNPTRVDRNSDVDETVISKNTIDGNSGLHDQEVDSYEYSDIMNWVLGENMEYLSVGAVVAPSERKMETRADSKNSNVSGSGSGNHYVRKLGSSSNRFASRCSISTYSQGAAYMLEAFRLAQAIRHYRSQSRSRLHPSPGLGLNYVFHDGSFVPSSPATGSAALSDEQIGLRYSQLPDNPHAVFNSLCSSTIPHRNDKQQSHQKKQQHNSNDRHTPVPNIVLYTSRDWRLIDLARELDVANVSLDVFFSAFNAIYEVPSPSIRSYPIDPVPTTTPSVDAADCVNVSAATTTTTAAHTCKNVQQKQHRQQHSKEHLMQLLELPGGTEISASTARVGLANAYHHSPELWWRRLASRLHLPSRYNLYLDSDFIPCTADFDAL